MEYLPLYIHIKGSKPLNNSNDFLIDRPNYFNADSKRKYMHYFEPGTRAIHLKNLDEAAETGNYNYVKHDLINDFKIPLDHSSIITPSGKLFLTGGIN